MKYTEPELLNIKKNKSEQLANVIVIAGLLTKLLKPVKFSDYNRGLKMAEEIIIRSVCTIDMGHMDESDFEEMLTNTLAYFASGLYDCDKTYIRRMLYYNVSGWRYTPETHNDAGEWFHIQNFDKENDAQRFAFMLKTISAELEKLHKN
jgi:hypothetical protein